MNKKTIKFVALILIIAFIIVFVNAVGFDNLLSPTMLKETVDSYGALAPLVFILSYTIATVLFIPGTPLTIAGGLIFGSFLGTVYTVIGATIGATIAFIIARKLGKEFIEDIIKNKFKKLSEYDEKMKDNGLLVILFLRIVPLFPFNGLNFALGLTRVKLSHYVIGTLIGIIPGSFVLAYFGDSLGSLSITNIVIAILLFVLLSLIPIVYKKVKKNEK